LKKSSYQIFVLLLKNSIQIDLLDVLQENWLQFPTMSTDEITPSLYPLERIDVNSVLIRCPSHFLRLSFNAKFLKFHLRERYRTNFVYFIVRGNEEEVVIS
jgi:hypothetical protein